MWKNEQYNTHLYITLIQRTNKGESIKVFPWETLKLNFQWWLSSAWNSNGTSKFHNEIWGVMSAARILGNSTLRPKLRIIALE